MRSTPFVRSSRFSVPAQALNAGHLKLQRLSRLDDNRSRQALLGVKGIGPWTADMFLLLQLRRLDVWPTGDFGVRQGRSRVPA